jgi:FKBP-type peptidyl-prolyl cis-trans isomerase
MPAPKKSLPRRFAPFLALLLLTACNKAPQTDASKNPTYDLSPASNARYLVDFAAKPGVFKTEDGLEYRIIKSGTGKAPQSGADMVTVKYKGALITGWVEALSLMKEGDEWELVIPSDLGYGPEGAGKDIPGNQDLVFTMTLVKVDPAQ